MTVDKAALNKMSWADARQELRPDTNNNGKKDSNELAHQGLFSKMQGTNYGQVEISNGSALEDYARIVKENGSEYWKKQSLTKIEHSIQSFANQAAENFAKDDANKGKENPFDTSTNPDLIHKGKSLDLTRFGGEFV